MNLLIVTLNRTLKILGALTKALSYFFHFIFKDMRFTIPKYSKAIIKSTQNTKIPKIIWQTNYTNKVTLPVYLNYLVNRILSLDFEYRFLDHNDRDIFMKQNAPKELFEAYNKLTDGAAQADVWRLFTLDHIGGVYMDIDAHLVWSLSAIIQDKDEVFIRAKRGHINNYFIASSKNNAILKTTLNMIIDNIQNKRIEKGVFSLTGPAVLNNAIKYSVASSKRK